MKTRLKGAHKGHSLLKKKADALKIRFHAVLKKIIEVSECTFNFVFCLKAHRLFVVCSVASLFQLLLYIHW